MESNQEFTLNDLYKQLIKHYDYVQKSLLPSNSDEIQDHVHDAICQCEKAIFMINRLSLFSTSEELEELSSESLKFMVIPALMAFFVEKSQRISRKEAVENCSKFYQDFLTICQNYSIPKLSDLEMFSNPQATALDPEKLRESKVKRARNLKQIEVHLKELEKYIDQEHIDEEVKRDYHLSTIQKWAFIACQEMDLLNKEMEILAFQEKRKDGKAELAPPSKPSAVQRPFILTKTALQSKVFGVGYPSLPTITIEEWYQSRFGNAAECGCMMTVGDGHQHEHELHCPHSGNHPKGDHDDEDKEEDPEKLFHQRNWDDWKDTHPRGFGNRMNRG